MSSKENEVDEDGQLGQASAEDTMPDMEGDASPPKDCPFPVKCCGNRFMRYENNDATGFQLFQMANGAVIVSNVFLAASLITLAKRSLGCQDDDEVCEGKVFGVFKPSSLILYAAAASGVLSAFFCPIIGAIIDYTRHRKTIGTVFAAFLIIIQATQIGTVEATWFPMAVLQAIAGFFLDATKLVAFSYLPEIKRVVGEEVMAGYTSTFYVWLYSSELFYTVLVVVISTVLKADDVLTAQVGQSVNVLLSGSFLILAYYFYTDKEPRHELPENSSLFGAGFKRVFQTTKGIIKYYPTTLARFYLAILFCRTATSSFITVAVTFTLEVLQIDGRTSGLITVVILLSTIPGALFAKFFMRRASPILCMKLDLVIFIAFNSLAFFTLNGPDDMYLIWPYGAIWGFLLGWNFPVEVYMFASLMPKGQEAELTGFYFYFSLVLSWLPPFVVSTLNENDISLNWGAAHLNIYFFLALICYQILPPWTECVEVVSAQNKMLSNKEKKDKFATNAL